MLREKASVSVPQPQNQTREGTEGWDRWRGWHGVRTPPAEGRVSLMVSPLQRLANSKAHTSRFISANLPCNKFKNRLVNIMPYETTRVCLQPIRGVEGSDYINASFIDGYRYGWATWVTQGHLGHLGATWATSGTPAPHLGHPWATWATSGTPVPHLGHLRATWDTCVSPLGHHLWAITSGPPGPPWGCLRAT